MLTIEIDAKQVINGLSLIEKSLRPAIAAGITKTMRGVEKLEIEAMKQQIDRPTPFTLNSLWLKPATPGNLEVTLGIKPKASEYLKRPILGGDVDNTLVPVLENERLNQYGNIISKRKGMKAIAKRKKKSFVAKINDTLAVWNRLSREHVNVRVFKDPIAPREPRFRYFQIADFSIKASVMRDIKKAINDVMRSI